MIKNSKMKRENAVLKLYESLSFYTKLRTQKQTHTTHTHTHTFQKMRHSCFVKWLFRPAFSIVSAQEGENKTKHWHWKWCRNENNPSPDTAFEIERVQSRILKTSDLWWVSQDNISLQCLWYCPHRFFTLETSPLFTVLHNESMVIRSW